MTEHNQHTPEEHAEDGHAHDDSAVVMGRKLPMPIYTAVYLALGALTIIEIALSQFERGFLTVPVMLALAFIKAGLVVWFYMHLNKDSRVFALTLIIPTLLVIAATVFLLIVPTGY